MSAGELDDLVREFIVESYENLDVVDARLVELERSPESAEMVTEIFRGLHTIKGTSGFFGFSAVERTSHAAENLLGAIRDGRCAIDKEVISALLRAADALRAIFGAIEASGAEGRGVDEDLVALLESLMAATGQPEAVPEPADVPSPEPESSAAREPVAEASVQEADGDGGTAGAASQKGAEVPAGSPTPGSVARERMSSAVADSSIRVDVALLDRLMNLVGELVLARNRLVQYGSPNAESGADGATQRLNVITTELQEEIMKTRMQPVRSIWARMPRVVRDLATECGKEVELTTYGAETELDRSVIEAIKDPLTHLLRNSVDHGIEMPEERVRKGKPRVGEVTLRAYHEGGLVNIEISDDGAGIDVERVRDVAVERGVISAQEASRIGEQEVRGLIFRPGFSTAREVTNVSGRGVGMDVVRTNIEKVNGTIAVEGRSGSGTTFRLKIPLTLAIVPALIVRCFDRRYAIPQLNLHEVVHVGGQEGDLEIEQFHGAPVCRLRGKLLPLIRLREHVKLEGEVDERSDDGEWYVLVLAAGNQRFGLVVDDVEESEEIVVKPLEGGLVAASIFAGATIMGDGRVALILDVHGLAESSGAIAEVRGRERIEEREAAGHREPYDHLLLLDNGPDNLMAVSLEAVDRLEFVRREQIQRVGPHSMIDYGGEILPVLRVEDIAEERRGAPRTRPGAPPKEEVPMVVFRRGSRRSALRVEQILDIVEVSGELQPVGVRKGVLGSIVIGDRIAERLDIEHLWLRARARYKAVTRTHEALSS